MWGYRDRHFPTNRSHLSCQNQMASYLLNLFIKFVTLNVTVVQFSTDIRNRILPQTTYLSNRFFAKIAGQPRFRHYLLVKSDNLDPDQRLLRVWRRSSSLPKRITSPLSVSASTAKPRLCNSFTKTRKEAGTPGS